MRTVGRNFLLKTVMLVPFHCLILHRQLSLEKVSNLLPELRDRFRQNAAFSALNAADACMKAGNLRDAFTRIKAALKYRSSFTVLRSASRIMLWNGTLSLLKKGFS